MQWYSPLRYPGGKGRLSQFIGECIRNLNIHDCTYIEPFAGGAGVALSLLLEGKVKNIIINDYDKAIYSFWRAVKETPNELINKIEQTPISVEEWHHQKQIYTNASAYSIELAFATLFLNRTNRSGILNAGPIGGYSQEGQWLIDARFDKEQIIRKIRRISKFQKNIKVYNKDIISLLENYIPKVRTDAFIYFDPPYYQKGQKLYKNFFTRKDHQRIFEIISDRISIPWLITYDNVEEILDLYENYTIMKYELIYSAANKGRAMELMIFSDGTFCPSQKQLEKKGINIVLRK